MITFLFTVIRFLHAIWNGLKEPDFRALTALVVVILLSGTFFYSQVEKWSLLDSLYFSVITLTTVGYGDLAPHTAVGKIFTMIYLFVGLGIILGFINVVARHAQENPIHHLISGGDREDDKKEDKKD